MATSPEDDLQPRAEELHSRAAGTRPSHPDVQGLLRKRRAKAGLVTKTEKKIVALRDAHPDEWEVAAISALHKELERYVDGFSCIQEQIEELLIDDEDAFTREADTVERNIELHAKLFTDLDRVGKQLELWSTTKMLMTALDALVSTEDKGTEIFRKQLVKLNESFCRLKGAPTPVLRNVHFQDRFLEIKAGIQEMTAAATDAAPHLASTNTTGPDKSPSRPTGHTISRMAPLNLEVSKFHGDPLAWVAFLRNLNSILKHRADGFCEDDKIAIIRQAIIPPAGRTLIDERSKDGATSDDILADLTHLFGRPQLVLPKLVKKATEAPRVDQTAASLLKFKEGVLAHYRSLVSLTKGDISLVFPHFYKPFLDGELAKDWDRLLCEKFERPTMEDFMKFIDQRLLWADSLKSSSTLPAQSQQPTQPPSQLSNKSYNSLPQGKMPSAGGTKCLLCSEAHWIGRCPSFAAMGTEERNQVVRTKKLCLNCLTPAHAVRNCTNRHSCRHCSQRHHTLLHRGTRTTTQPATAQATPAATPSTVAVVASQAASAQSTPGQSTVAAHQSTQDVNYFTCSVTARLHENGVFTRARVLLDHGSGGNLITDELATLLKLSRHPQDKLFTGLGQGSVRSKSYVTTKLMSTSSSFSTEPVQLSIIPKAIVTPAPSNTSEVVTKALDMGISLSDPELGGKIDVVLGGDLPWRLCGESISIPPYRFISTQFGYGAIGPLSHNAAVLTITNADSSLSEDLTKLWALDRVPEAAQLSLVDQQALTRFNESTCWTQGRVQVSLPFKDTRPSLGNSRSQALSRLYRNEESLAKKQKLDAFNLALREYLTLGHAHIVPPDELHTATNATYYMPVHGVFKATSSTTKTRPVFDASASTSTGASLNDCLLVGPNLYPQLADILLKFRIHTVGLSADISKMFREIRLDPDHYNYHRFLLRDEHGAIQDCRMERVTFGVASSPFLATQTLRFVADTHKAEFPRAAELIHTTFYVDDFVSGARDSAEATAIQQELCALLAKAGMVLRKWRSNSTTFINATPTHLRETDDSPLSLQESPKALGSHWDTITDTLYIAVPPTPDANKKATKRTVASLSAAVFDIMGLFSPTTVLPRMLLQQAWKLRLPWDKPLPPEMEDTWNSWLQDLPIIGSHPIPRRFFPGAGDVRSTTLHGFSDASEKAYGAAIYLRIMCADGSTYSCLVTAKSRVLPIKHTTVPRAELLAAHLLARLLTHIATLLDVPLHSTFAWTDSAIVLHWLSKDVCQLKDRFIANRIQACQDLLPSVKWLHVPTADNPADIASRGLPAKDLVHSRLWWSGPPWLTQSPDGWPVLKLTRPPETTPILTISAPTSIPSCQHNFLEDLWSRYSSLHTLERVVAYILRFYNSTRLRTRQDSLTLSPTEISGAQNALLKLAQRQGLPEVFAAVANDSQLPRSHNLHGVLPTVKDEVLYVRTRVRSTHDSSTPKVLILLPPKSGYTALLLNTAHSTLHHSGVGALHAIIADAYYVTGLRNALKKISRQCATCQRAYARPLSQQMGLLPSVRSSPSPPFSNTGVDFAGPFWLRRGHTRKPVHDKCWVAVFVCMTTKAVHLDVCSSLSTEDFLATLSRFVARRGCPTNVYSDNGSNFIGARESLGELETLLLNNRDKITSFTHKKGIKWHTIPPRAPHFGGLWEAAVKQMKLLLAKNIAPHKLRFDELYTLLAEVESILNSRPLNAITQEDTATGSILTPGHFLIGRPLGALPTQEETRQPSTLRRWRLVTSLKQQLWSQWLKVYLQTQHDRNRWTKPQENVKVDDLVFLKDTTLDYRVWPLARVTKVFPGDDGKVRAAEVSCKGKTYLRAVQMLIPLHLDEQESSTSK